MSPFDQAAQWCKQHGEDFAQQVEFFSRNGVCYFDTRCAVMAMPIEDTWIIWLLVGKDALGRLFQLAPYPLPFVAWSRIDKGKPLRSYSFERLKKLIVNGGTNHGRSLFPAQDRPTGPN